MPLDIFSKRQTEKEKIIVIVDDREKNSLVPSELVKMGCQISFQHLDIGDYLAGNSVIERKTLPDLQASLIDKRIFGQLRALKSQDNPIVLIERSEAVWRLPENALRGIVLTIARQNIPVIFADNERDSAGYIALLAKSGKEKGFSLRPYRKTETKEEKIRYILEGFPGVGPVTSKKLIGRFGTLKKVISASLSELKEVIGRGAEEFINLVN